MKKEGKKITKKSNNKKNYQPKNKEKKYVKKDNYIKEKRKETNIHKRRETLYKSLTIIIIFTFLCFIMIWFAAAGGNYTKPANVDFITLDIAETDLYSNYTFQTYSDYQEKIGGDMTKLNFADYNYVFFKVEYNPCVEKNIKPSKAEFRGNNITVTIDYEGICGGCAPDELYYLLKVDKNITDPDIELEYNAVTKEKCNQMVAYKPIIYLYPQEEMNISIKLLNEQNLTTTYPEYHQGWDVYAYPNGDLIDNNTGRKLYALYWEGNNHHANVMEEGFVVRGKDTISFLEEKLHLLGLTDHEADEFIIYWLPKMEHNKYNYIRFETMEEINYYMPISIDPTPDSIIRIQMDFKPLDNVINVKEQQLKTPFRSGFTVVEWGGSIIE